MVATAEEPEDQMSTPSEQPRTDPASGGPATPEEVERRASTPDWVTRPTASSEPFSVGPTAPAGPAGSAEGEWLDLRLVILGIGSLVAAVLCLAVGSLLAAGVFALVAVVVLVTAYLLERAMRRDPWRRPLRPRETPTAPPVVLPPPAPGGERPQRRLPIGPGRAGGAAADRLLGRSEEHRAP